MPIVEPIEPGSGQEKAEQTFGRIREVFGVEEIPEVFRYMAHVPFFLHDFFMNFRKFVLTGGKLGEKEKLLIALAVSGKEGCGPFTDYLLTLCESRQVSSQEVVEAMAVGSTNSMYNALFKFKDIAGTDVFDGMGVGLRAHTFQQTSLEKTTVELLNIALSDLNACKPCTAAHVAEVRKMGVADEAVFEAIQCAATVISATQYLKSIQVG